MDVTSNSVMQFSVFMKLTEPEARALKELTVFGFDNFVKVFYEHLGKSTMQPHEEGLKSLFESIKNEIPKHLSRIDKTKKTFLENNPNKP